MTTKKKLLIGILAVVALLGGALLVTQAPSYAKTCTNLILADDDCADMGYDDVNHLIHVVINILTVGMIVGATIGVIYCGYMILTARENTEKIAKGKKRIFEIVIGLALWFCAFGLVNLFIPNSNIEELDQLPQGGESAETPPAETPSGDDRASEVGVPAAKSPTGDEGVGQE